MAEGKELQKVEWSEEAMPFIKVMAEEYGLSPRNLWACAKRQCISGNPTNEQMVVYMQWCRANTFNPFNDEAYGFVDKKGKLVKGVTIDGALRVANSHPQYNGMELEDVEDERGNLTAVICKVWRKDRGHPVVIPETLAENKRGTQPWKQKPRRMLRHKAAIQGIRYAFSLTGLPVEEARDVAAGLYDTDELPASASESADAVLGLTEGRDEPSEAEQEPEEEPEGEGPAEEPEIDVAAEQEALIEEIGKAYGVTVNQKGLEAIEREYEFDSPEDLEGRGLDELNAILDDILSLGSDS